MFPDLNEGETKRNETGRNEGYSDSEWDDGPTPIKATNQKLVKPLGFALAALFNAYGSGTESDGDNVEDKQEKSNIDNGRGPSEASSLSDLKSLSSNIMEASVDAVDDDSGPEEVSILRQDSSGLPCPVVQKSHTTTNDVSNEDLCQDNKRCRRRKHSRWKPENEEQVKENKEQVKKPVKYVPPKRLTLLHKLLEPEIRHERNVVLQCIRYIVQNNSFNIVK